MGEVGKALYEVLSPHYECHTKDLEPKELPQCDIMHVCIRHSQSFQEAVQGYISKVRPKIVNICTTVPPGTTEALGGNCVHSTTRGLHPKLALGLKTITKHIGGPKAAESARYFEKAGVPCVTHERAITTEVAHLLNNAHYAVNVAFADDMAAICRQFGVDYYEAVMHYTRTNNEGFSALDHKSKCRMILTPPGGRIGGHCLVQAAKMLKESGVSTPVIERLAVYNDKE